MQCRAGSEVRLTFSRLCPAGSWTLQGQRLHSLWGLTYSSASSSLCWNFSPVGRWNIFCLCCLSLIFLVAPLWKMEVCCLDNLSFIRLWLGASGAVFSSGWTSPVSPTSQRACAPYLLASWWPFALALFCSEAYYLFLVSGSLKLDVVF